MLFIIAQFIHQIILKVLFQGKRNWDISTWGITSILISLLSSASKENPTKQKPNKTSCKMLLGT